jgi:hypothetical protein
MTKSWMRAAISSVPIRLITNIKAPKYPEATSAGTDQDLDELSSAIVWALIRCTESNRACQTPEYSPGLTRGLCRDSKKEGRNLQKTSVTDGFFWRCKARSGTVIEPISNPRPLPCKPLPFAVTN